MLNASFFRKTPPINTWSEPLELFFNKLDSGAATKIAFLGDSTSDGSANAGGLYTQFDNVAKGSRYGRWANSIALDFGQNGATTTAWLGSSGAKSLAALITAAPDLVFLCLGINDRRTQAVSVATMDANIRSILTSIFNGIPNVSVIVYEPQAFLITGVGGYITSGTGQAGTDEIRNVYRGLLGFHPKLIVCPLQDILGGDIVWNAVNNPPIGNRAIKYPANILSGSGRVALTTTTGWIHVDGIHPINAGSYAARIDVWTSLYGRNQPLDITAANNAQGSNYYSPFISYPRSLELTTYWQEICAGYHRGATANQGYIDVDLENSLGVADSATAQPLVAGGDVMISESGTPEVLGLTPTISIQNAQITRLWQTGYPAASIPAGRFKVYRHRFLRDATIETNTNNSGLPWKRWGRVQQGGSNFIVFQSLSTAIVNQYGWETHSKDWTLANSDIIVIVNGDGSNEQLTLTGCTFGINGTFHKQVQNGTFSGNSSSRVGKYFAVFGNHV